MKAFQTVTNDLRQQCSCYSDAVSGVRTYLRTHVWVALFVLCSRYALIKCAYQHTKLSLNLPSSMSSLTVASSSRTLSVKQTWLPARLLTCTADFLPRRPALRLSCFSYCAYAFSCADRLFLDSFSRSDIDILSMVASSATSSAWLAISCAAREPVVHRAVDSVSWSSCGNQLLGNVDTNFIISAKTSTICSWFSKHASCVYCYHSVHDIDLGYLKVRWNLYPKAFRRGFRRSVLRKL